MIRHLWLAGALALAACSGGAEETEEPIVVDGAGSENTSSEDTSSEDSTAEDLTGPDHGGDDTDVVVGDDVCETDADCVPVECCHAAACVARANAPDCGDTMCTEECRMGTLDCGGACVCIDGRCGARLSQIGDVETDPGLR